MMRLWSGFAPGLSGATHPTTSWESYMAMVTTRARFPYLLEVLDMVIAFIFSPDFILTRIR